jgi:AcrR family transcriptional regulator
MARRLDDTRSRLIDAASELFAERGFHATTARDIARRAGVNLAAGNYHYGSKKELYLEVLRAQFAAVGQRLARRGGKPPGSIKRLSREDAALLLRRRIAAMLEMLIGPPPMLHGALMQREMADPSEAMPIVVEEFVRPMSEEMERIVARLAPDLSSDELRLTVISIISQTVFYRFARPAVLAVYGLDDFPHGFAGRVADHVVAFSLGGLSGVAARKKRRLRAR